MFSAASCIGFTNLLQAQDTPFIQPVTADQIPASPEIGAYKDRLRKNPNIADNRFIKLNPIASSQKDGVLLLHIPDGPVIKAAASHVEYESANEYEWIGKTDDDRGTVIVISKAGRVCAHISTPAGVYEIFPAPSGLHSLQKIYPEKAWDVGCATTSSTTNPNNGRTVPLEPVITQEGNANAKMQPCQAVAYPRVLVLFTLLAYTQEGSVAAIIDKANLSVAQFNSCIYNSGITSAATLT